MNRIKFHEKQKKPKFWTSEVLKTKLRKLRFQFLNFQVSLARFGF